MVNITGAIPAPLPFLAKLDWSTGDKLILVNLKYKNINTNTDIYRKNVSAYKES